MLAKHASTPLVWLLTAAVVCFISTACATEKGSEKKESQPAQKAEEKAEPGGQGEQDVKVYTNEDLERMFGEEESAESAAPPTEEAAGERKPVMEVKVEPEPTAKPATDPLSRMQQQQAEAEDHARAVEEAKQAVADARKRVAQLEERVLAVKNPFLARPVIPDDEKAQWDSMGARERLEDSETKLKQAREELAAAEKKLAGMS